jgi:hypothetical protein
MGESFWAFLPRSVWGSLQSAWALEQERLNTSRPQCLAPQNHNLQAWGLTLLLFGALVAWLGWMVLALFGVAGGVRHLDAGGGELRGALRFAAPA